MPLRSLASLGVKLIAVYALLQSLGSLALTWVLVLRVVNQQVNCSIISCFPDWQDVLPGLITGGVQLSASVGLWCFAERVATLIVKNPASPAPEGNWRSLGFGVLGVFLLLDCVSLFAAQFLSDHTLTQIPIPVIWSQLLRGFVGLCLLFGSRTVRGLFNFRNWGRDKEEIV